MLEASGIQASISCNFPYYPFPLLQSSFFSTELPIFKLKLHILYFLHHPKMARDGAEEVVSTAAVESHASEELVVDVFPLSGYYFGASPTALLPKNLSLSRSIANYQARGLRTCVQAVLLVELFKHPHLLLLQVRNSTFKLPGGRLRIGEPDIGGLRRKLSRKLSLDEGNDEPAWEVSECLGMWWKPDFETLYYPYLPPNIKSPKECAKLYLVKLPVSRKFIVPKNMKLLAVPLCQVHENHKTYGTIIAGIPQLLSKYSLNMIET